jgi:hypothetical protein
LHHFILDHAQFLLPFDCLEPFLDIFPLVPKVVHHEIDVLLFTSFGRIEMPDVRLKRG